MPNKTTNPGMLAKNLAISTRKHHKKIKKLKGKLAEISVAFDRLNEADSDDCRAEFIALSALIDPWRTKEEKDAV